MRRKAGVLGPMEEVRVLELRRDRLGDNFGLRIDPNRCSHQTFDLGEYHASAPSIAALYVFIPAISLAAEPDRDVASLPARPSPPWLTKGILYQIWLRSFTPEGTLQAATQRLPDVAELGATIVYLPPVMLLDDDPRPEFWSPRQKQSGTNNPKNPYRIKDYGLSALLARI